MDNFANNDDTISRAGVMDALNGIEISRNASWYEFYQKALTAVGALPPAQKKGHWIDEGTNYACSECHRGCWVNSNYCPWCGADMRGEDDE